MYDIYSYQRVVKHILNLVYYYWYWGRYMLPEAKA